MNIDHLYWKHENSLDVFFCVTSIMPDGMSKNQLVYGTWCTQGIEQWFFTYQDRIKITEQQMPKWKRYYPKGKLHI